MSVKVEYLAVCLFCSESLPGLPQKLIAPIISSSIEIIVSARGNYETFVIDSSFSITHSYCMFIIDYILHVLEWQKYSLVYLWQEAYHWIHYKIPNNC